MRYFESLAIAFVSVAVLGGCSTAPIGAPPIASDGLARPTAGLRGERFSSTQATSQCSSGSRYSISGTFHVSGKARGPFPGAFTARGQVKVSITTLKFSEHFQIRSGSQVIAGFASAPASSGSPTFACSIRHKLSFAVEQLLYRVKGSHAVGGAAADLSGRSFSEGFQ
jgi:hypothetical protein